MYNWKWVAETECNTRWTGVVRAKSLPNAMVLAMRNWSRVALGSYMGSDATTQYGEIHINCFKV